MRGPQKASVPLGLKYHHVDVFSSKPLQETALLCFDCGKFYPLPSRKNSHARCVSSSHIRCPQEIAAELAAASEAPSDRRLEALRVIHYKLEKLEQHLHNSSRALNDLRSLRRLLFDERTEPATPVRRAHKDTGAV
jgi:hypothetical protein